MGSVQPFVSLRFLFSLILLYVFELWTSHAAQGIRWKDFLLFLFVITYGQIALQGFKDLLQIGNQARPKIFDLTVAKPSCL